MVLSEVLSAIQARREGEGLAPPEALELSPGQLHTLRHKLMAASYGLGGMDWKALFRQLDRDGSGEVSSHKNARSRPPRTFPR